MASLGSLGYPLGAGYRVREQYYLTLVSSLGDAFTIDSSTPVREIELRAIAAFFADLGENSTRSLNELIPSKAVRTLALWAQRMGVRASTDAELRAALAAKYKAPNGPTAQNIIDTVQTALGSDIRQILFADGVEAQENTFWAGVNPRGTQDLGTDAVGEYSSLRSHILVVLSEGHSVDTILRKTEETLRPLLDSLLPGYCTWDYQISNSDYDGFTLDDDSLDLTAL